MRQNLVRKGQKMRPFNGGNFRIIGPRRRQRWDRPPSVLFLYLYLFVSGCWRLPKRRTCQGQYRPARAGGGRRMGAADPGQDCGPIERWEKPWARTTMLPAPCDRRDLAASFRRIVTTSLRPE